MVYRRISGEITTPDSTGKATEFIPSTLCTVSQFEYVVGLLLRGLVGRTASAALMQAGAAEQTYSLHTPRGSKHQFDADAAMADLNMHHSLGLCMSVSLETIAYSASLVHVPILLAAV